MRERLTERRLSKRNAGEGCLESKGADLEVNLVGRTLTADKDLM